MSGNGDCIECAELASGLAAPSTWNENCLSKATLLGRTGIAAVSAAALMCFAGVQEVMAQQPPNITVPSGVTLNATQDLGDGGSITVEEGGTIDVPGPAVPANDAVFGQNIDTVTNDGTIRGGRDGVHAVMDLDTLINGNEISGGRDGVYAGRDIKSILNRNVISGGRHGVLADRNIENLINQGTIRGGEFGVVATAADGTGGNIMSLTNYTLIEGVAGGVGAAGNIETLINEKDGVIRGTRPGNRAAGAQGVGAAGDIGRLINRGLIEGGENGVAAGNFDPTPDADGNIRYLNNSGTIRGRVGGENGVFANRNVETAINSGVIEGHKNGFGVLGDLDYLTNSGRIEGHVSEGFGRDASHGVGVLGSIGTLNNSGTIRGVDYGIAAGSIRNLTNSGTVEGHVAVSSFFEVERLVNSRGGVIRGGSTEGGAGVRMQFGAIVNSGLIEGYKGIVSVVPVGPPPPFPVDPRKTSISITNAGTIRSTAGPGGLAIKLAGPGFDTLTLLNGSVIEGLIKWDGIGDTLNYRAKRSAVLSFTGPRRLVPIYGYGGPMPQGPYGGPIPQGPYGGPIPQGPYGGPIPQGPYGGPMPQGPYGGPMPQGPYGGPIPPGPGGRPGEIGGMGGRQLNVENRELEGPREVVELEDPREAVEKGIEQDEDVQLVDGGPGGNAYDLGGYGGEGIAPYPEIGPNGTMAIYTPEQFKVNAGGRPVVWSAHPFGVSVVIIDPTAFALADNILFDTTSAISGAVTGQAAAWRATRSGGRIISPAADVIRSDGHSISEGGWFTRLWADVFGGVRDEEGDGALGDARHDFGGVVAGAETGTAGMRVGFFIGGSVGKADIEGGSQDIDITTVFGGPYFSAEGDGVAVDGMVTFGLSDYDSTRSVNDNLIAGGVDSAKADYNGFFVAPEITVSSSLGMVRPSLTLRYAGLFLESYSEKSSILAGQDAGLNVDDRDIHQISARAHLGKARVRGSVLGQGFTFDAGGDDEVLTGFGGFAVAYAVSSRFTLNGNVEGAYGTDEAVTGRAHLGAKLEF